MASPVPNHSLIIITALAITSLLIPFLSAAFTKLGQEEHSLFDRTTNVVNVFAASEGLIRCTDGKLTTSQDQCPETDQCPPPQNNTVSNCISHGPTNATSINATAAGSSGKNTTNDETTAKTSHCLKNRFTLHTPQCTSIG